MKLLRALIGVSLFVIASVAHAGFDEGMAAYEKGDYKTAVAEWRPIAEQGYAGAQFNLGAMYGRGQGVPQDYKEAMKWYRKAAEQDDAVAQNNLGRMYGNGEGVPQDDKEAYAWFSVAAANGFSESSKNRDMAAETLTPSQLEQGQALAKKYFEKYQPKP